MVVVCENPCLAEMGVIRTTIIISCYAKVLVNFVSFKFNMSVDKICRWLNIIAIKDATYEYYMQGLFQNCLIMESIILIKQKQQEELFIATWSHAGKTNMRFLDIQNHLTLL